MQKEVEGEERQNGGGKKNGPNVESERKDREPNRVKCK